MVTATRTRVRRAVLEEPEEEQPLLQEIFELPQPDRQLKLNEWLDAADYDTEHGGTVKVGTPDGKPMQVPMEGKTFHVPPAGKRVTREMAVRLLLRYGEQGRFRGLDQATGMTQLDWEYMPEDNRKVFRNYTPKFLTNYLVQLPEVGAREDTEPNV